MNINSQTPISHHHNQTPISHHHNQTPISHHNQTPVSHHNQTPVSHYHNQTPFSHHNQTPVSYHNQTPVSHHYNQTPFTKTIKKRGRPPKISNTPLTTISKKRKYELTPGKTTQKRGRPRKSLDTLLTPGKTAQKRGRPRKSLDTSLTPGKTTQKRGRPRKSLDTLLTPGKTIKKRGRPRKSLDTLLTPGKTAQKRGRPRKSLNTKLFGIYPTEEESLIESYLAVLINLMGGLIGQSYIEDVLGVKMIATSRSTNPGKDMVPGETAIFHGTNPKATHYTATTDGVELWDSYKRGIQMHDTHNFCQTFSMMYINNYIQPHTELGQEFLKLKRGEYMDNAYIAKTYACGVLEYMDKYFMYDDERMERIIQDEVMFVEKGKIKGDVRGTFNLKEFIKRCKKITKDDMCKSSFKEQVFLL